MHYHIAAGRAARRRGDAAAALAAFAAAIPLDRRGELAIVEYGEELRRHHQIARAAEQAQCVLQRHPLSLPALMLAGRCARDLGNPAAARSWFGQAAATTTDDPAPLTELGHEQRKAGLLDAAEASYRAAFALAPDRIFALLGLARCARMRGDTQTALAWRRQAGELSPGNLAVQTEIANDLRDLARLDEAADIYAAVLALDPADYAALMGSAALTRQLGDAEGALAAWGQAASARPGELAPRLQAIALHRDLGNTDEARRLADALLASDPDSPAGWVQIGWIERSLGNAQAAYDAFAEAHARAPDDVDTLVQMAVETRALGDRPRCEALFADAIRRDPSHGGALLQNGLHALAANENATALELFRRAIDSGRGRVPAALGACEALARLGQVDAAVELLEETERRAGADPSLAARRITLLRETGDLPASLAALRPALPEATRHAGLFLAVMRTLLIAGEEAEIDACLAAFRPVSERDRVILATLHGFAAEERGNLTAASASFERAAALRAQDSGGYLDLTRTALLAFDPDTAMATMRRNRALATPQMRLLGQSANVSQTHYGQMIDEYRMDRALLTQVRDAWREPPAARLSPLLSLARANPDSTLASVAAVEALWTAGLLRPPTSDRAAPPAIPRRIMQYWDQVEPPADVLRLMASWPTLNPDYDYQRFDHRAARRFLWDHCTDEAAIAYRRASQPAHKADLLRLALLWEYGGIYADADDRCIGQLGVLVQPNDTLVLHREDLGTLGNNFIAVVPRHPMIRRAFDTAVEATNRGDSDLLWFSTGPGLITRCFVAELVAAPDLSSALAGMRIVSRRGLHRTVAAHCRTAYKKTIRHWENSSFNRTAGRLQAAEPT